MSWQGGEVGQGTGDSCRSDALSSAPELGSWQQQERGTRQEPGLEFQQGEDEAEMPLKALSKVAGRRGQAAAPHPSPHQDPEKGPAPPTLPGTSPAGIGDGAEALGPKGEGTGGQSLFQAHFGRSQNPTTAPCARGRREEAATRLPAPLWF